MIWDIFNLIGIIAFALSGAIIAMEVKYDVVGIFVVGLTTAFGGGIIRNILIGIPTITLWEQETLLYASFGAIAVIMIVPMYWVKRWKTCEPFFDAIGLSAFSIQGALYAVQLDLPLMAVLAASVLTGAGGGMIRDLLVGRKPLILREEIYALWAVLGGLVVWLHWAQSPLRLFILFCMIVSLRMISVKYRWKLPRRSEL